MSLPTKAQSVAKTPIADRRHSTFSASDWTILI